MEANKWCTDRRWAIDVSIDDGQASVVIDNRLRDLIALYLTSHMGPPQSLRNHRFFRIQDYL